MRIVIILTMVAAMTLAALSLADGAMGVIESSQSALIYAE